MNEGIVRKKLILIYHFSITKIRCDVAFFLKIV
jgi:hypothetical protein